MTWRLPRPGIIFAVVAMAAAFILGAVLPASAAKPPPPALDTVVVNNTSLPLAPGQTVSVSVACPAGYVATGGGWSQNSGGQGDLTVLTSHPFVAGGPATTWVAEATNPTGNTLPGLSAQVICARVQ